MVGRARSITGGIIEAIVPEDAKASLANLSDIETLVVTGGRERTPREYQALLARRLALSAVLRNPLAIHHHRGDKEGTVKILVIGATGTIGAAVAHALEARHEVVRASHSRADLKVDLADPDSIKRLYTKVGRVDAVVSAAGQAAFGPLLTLSDADFALCLSNKLMGQVNFVRFGVEALADGGSFTLTSGILSRLPMPGGAAISMINAGLEGFGRAAALELPRNLRINVVAPGWIRETLLALKMDPSPGVPAAEVAETYVKAVEGSMNGQVLDALAVA
jgi:NAD(P)-dependent dehydrogenase (short-subunit alcohol dehydrogenase family)